MKRRTFIRTFGLGASLPWLGRAALAAPGALPNAGVAPLTILTCNIRVALPEDEAAGENPRCEDTARAYLEVIRAQKPDIICLQEVIREQMEDLEHGFPEFASFGFSKARRWMPGRSVTRASPRTPILYSRARYDFVSAGGFWLSETPHLPGSLCLGSRRAPGTSTGCGCAIVRRASNSVF